MFKSITDIEKKIDVPFDNANPYTEQILDIFNGNLIIDINENNGYLLTLQGLYYKDIEKNYDEMKKYYLAAIEKGRSDAMANLGVYYQNIKKNYPEMKKYYLMAIAINKEDSIAMHNLGFYYYKIEKNYPEMMKYYIMAIEKGNSKAMNRLGFYYNLIEKNYPEMIKYYIMAIEKGNSSAMNNLGLYYYNIEKNYSEMMKYYLMAIEKRESIAMYNLGYYYYFIENYPEMKKYYLMALQHGFIKDAEHISFLLADDEIIEQLTIADTELILEKYSNKFFLKSSDKLFLKYLQKAKRVEEVEAKLEHFKYHPNGMYYDDMEKEFYELYNNHSNKYE